LTPPLRKVEKYLLFVADAAAINLAFWLAFWLRYHSGFFIDTFDPARSFTAFQPMALGLSLLWTAWFTVTGLYRDWSLQSRALQFSLVAREVTFLCIALVAIATGTELVAAAKTGNFSGAITASRVSAFGLSWLLFLSCVISFRIGVHAFVRGRLKRGLGADRLLILGATGSGEAIRKELQLAPELGWRAVGFLDENPSLRGEGFAGLPVLGKYSDLPQLITAHRVGGILISHESSSHNEILRILSYVPDAPLNIFIVPDLYDAATGHFKTNAVHGIALKELFPEHMPAWKARLKRVMDMALAGAGLIITAPLMALIAWGVRRDSPGPALYAQERVGQYGKLFHLLKFRTMRTDAEKAGPQWASAKDPRVTRLGRFLRRTRLDELPQLWCVLKGDMSLVGPRPEREHFISQLRYEVPLYLRRLKMKPGLTGWAQVKHHYDANIEDVKTKVLFDLWYFENMSLTLDLVILVRTVWVVVSGKGAR
jgi:exopolysaccharide biosynthesis polyprenyl glycosylphosphotransferase